jgi:hypothetical protein
MRTTLAVSLALVAVVGAVSVAAAAGSLGPAVQGQEATPVQSVDGSAPNGSNASMGAEVSAFMQASASDANASVDEGMFAAAWNRSNASAADLVEKRTNTLENRLDALQNQKERLLAKKGQLSDVAYTARMSALASRIGALQDAINATSARATDAGVNATRLAELKANASELSGPEVAAIARNLSVGVGPGATARGNGPGGNGPPGQAGTGNNSTPGNGAPGAENGNGNANDGSNGSANATTPVENPGNDTIQGPTLNGSNETSGNVSTPGSGTGDGDDEPPGNGGSGGNGPNAVVTAFAPFDGVGFAERTASRQ